MAETCRAPSCALGALRLVGLAFVVMNHMLSQGPWALND